MLVLPTFDGVVPITNLFRGASQTAIHQDARLRSFDASGRSSIVSGGDWLCLPSTAQPIRCGERSQPSEHPPARIVRDLPKNCRGHLLL